MVEGAGEGPAGVAEAAAEFAGEPDGLQRLWTPHRLVYIQGEAKPTSGDAGPDCPFCRAPTRTDEDGLIVHRGELAYAVLNLFPYNPGHVLICPYRHVAGYAEMTPEETVEVAVLTQQAIRVLTRASGPHGFNLGINLGSAAGAGIAAHLHQHVVPRWGGDANFMPVTGQVKVLPELLADTRERLARTWTGEANPP